MIRVGPLKLGGVSNFMHKISTKISLSRLHGMLHCEFMDTQNTHIFLSIAGYVDTRPNGTFLQSIRVPVSSPWPPTHLLTGKK